MPAAIWAGFQCRLPKLRKSMWRPREFGKRIGFSDAGRRSSASSAIACSGTARVLSRVFVFLSRPLANTRRTYTTPAARSISLLERKQLRRSKSGRGGEDDHRPVDGTEPLGDRLDLLPRLERPLLLVPPRRF